MMIGYARVSTGGQNLESQIDALTAAGCEKIFTDKGVSGVSAFKPQLEAVMEFAREGDVLVVTRLDRLDRSMKFMLDRVEALKAKGVQWKSLGENIDATGPTGELVFHIFTAIAQFERGRISERTKAGLKSAKARGRMGGRPRTIPEEMWAEMKPRLADGDRVSKLASIYNVSRQSIYRMIELDKADA